MCCVEAVEPKRVLLAQGDSFGEGVLLGVQHVYTYTVRTLVPSAFYEIPASDFLHIFKDSPGVLQSMRVNAERVLGNLVQHTEARTAAGGCLEFCCPHAESFDFVRTRVKRSGRLWGACWESCFMFF